MTQAKKTKTSTKIDAFSRIAFWQLMSFLILLCFVWVNEVMDLPAALFGAAPTTFSFYRGCLLSAVIIIGAVVTVGHTYEQQKAVVRSLLTTCSYCHRVQTSAIEWEHVEEYFLKHYPLEVRRGICPECETMLKDLDEQSIQRPAPAAPQAKA